jgi:hypothetical protein
MVPPVQESCFGKSPACTIYREASGAKMTTSLSGLTEAMKCAGSSHLKRSEICMELGQKWNVPYSAVDTEYNDIFTIKYIMINSTKSPAFRRTKR